MKHLISTFLLGVYLFISTTADAQYGNILWTEYGQPSTAANSMMRDIHDNGYIMAGYRGTGMTDSAAIFHTNDLGVQDWHKTFHNNGSDISFYTIITTADTSYVALGVKDFQGNMNDDCSVWLVKMDDTGTIIWEKTFGGTGSDFLYDIHQTADGGFIAVGKTSSTTVPGYHDLFDLWVVKFDAVGDIEWQKAYGGSTYDEGEAIIETTGGEYYVLGSVSSDDGDVSTLQGLAGYMDIWVMKLDNVGNIIWEKTYGGTNDEYAGHFIMSDTTLMVKGMTYSNNGHVSFNHGNTDSWVMRLDTMGTIIWEKTYGGAVHDGGGRGKIKETTPGNYTILTYATNPVAGTNGDLHCFGDGGWVFNITNTGALNWEWQCGGGVVGVEYNSGSYVLAGTLYPYMSYISQHWMRRVEETNVLDCDNTLYVNGVKKEENIEVYPTITNGTVYVRMPSGYENAVIQLTDIVGKPVSIQEHSRGITREVSIDGVATGLYLLTVVNGQKVQTVKLYYQP